MKTFEFKQNDLKRGVPFAIAYFVVLIIACYLTFGGLFGMANALSNFGSAKLAAIVVSLAVLAPFIIILNLLMPKIKVELASNNLTISDKNNQKVVFYNEIFALQLNMSNLNRLDIMGQQNNLLGFILPQNNPEILAQVISEISNHVNFTKLKGSKKYFGKSIETSLYNRKI
ncbi:MAG: hypothetical protein EOO87_06550 [Pedobacter sp.]|nr:MAG: hypothetical protein EOO87_06550 [Pedobacter sp.]